MTDSNSDEPGARAVAVRHNAVRHGLRTHAIVIPGFEEQADWEQFSHDVIEAVRPANAIEYALAERIAQLAWRLRRASRAEREATIAQAALDNAQSQWHQRDLERKAKEFGPRSRYQQALDTPAIELPPRSLPPTEQLASISKYEARLNRQFLRTLHELEAIQDRRAGRAAPLARLDVDIDVDGERE
jgi:hypothetical protein